jgi:uncharacterized membrane protein
MQEIILVKGSVFAGWGTLALINASIAQLQKRSAWLWWFISLLCCPIATFILLVTYKKS